MSHPVDFATKKIERRKNFCVGPVMYDNTCQFSGVWHGCGGLVIRVFFLFCGAVKVLSSFPVFFLAMNYH